MDPHMYLSFTQTLLENRMSVRVGRLTLNSVFGEEFTGSEYFKSFASIGFDLIPEGVFFNVSGAAGYPRTTWGTRLRYSPKPGFYAQAAAYNSDSNQLNGAQHGIDFSLHGPLFAIGEVGFSHFAQDNASKPTRQYQSWGILHRQYPHMKREGSTNLVLKGALISQITNLNSLIPKN
jgi:porin